MQPAKPSSSPLCAQAGARLVTTTATAIRHALESLRARRVVLLTPYSEQVTDEEAEFLHMSGFQVLYARGFALKGSDEYCAAPAQFWRDRAIEAARPEADAYFLSCANISAFPVIEEIEQKLGRPVVTSNQAVIWEALSLLGATDRRNCPGRLFDTSRRNRSCAEGARISHDHPAEHRPHPDHPYRQPAAPARAARPDEGEIFRPALR